ncbi:MAG: hypothetical protein R2860_07530 [Desulfobacterales bacterium]
MIEAISLHRKMPEKAAWEYAEQWLAKVGISMPRSGCTPIRFSFPAGCSSGL